MPGRAFSLLLLACAACVAESRFEFVQPTRVATASCTDFPWVSDLAICLESARLLELAATKKWGVAPDRIDSWNNGSAAEFLEWLDSVAQKGTPDATLILYFVTHQLSDGDFKFSKGPDLPASEFVEALNRLARKYDRVILLDDCCYGALLEGGGKFFDNILRVYAASEDEEAYNFRFGKGPYGLDKFLKSGRDYLKQQLGWEPPGMTFMGMITLKSALELAEKPGDSVDIQTLYRRMAANRDAYDESIRQKKVQHILLVPPTCDWQILVRRKDAS
jgi:hypothetical protein